MIIRWCAECDRLTPHTAYTHILECSVCCGPKELDHHDSTADEKLAALFAPILCLPDLVSVEVLERNLGDAPAWNSESFNRYIPLSGLNYLELCNDTPVFEDVVFHPGNPLYDPLKDLEPVRPNKPTALGGN